MNKPLFLFVGPSGCGKTTVAQTLDLKYNYKTIQSYTTRKPRYDEEIGHIFISEDEFDALKNIIAYTQYNGYRYCTTQQQLDEASSYVVDISGVETLLQNYNTKRPILIFYLATTVSTRIDRMIDRGDSDMEIVSRLHNDEKYDWEHKLNLLVWHYNNIVGKQVEMYTINANHNIRNVLEMILYYIDRYISI